AALQKILRSGKRLSLISLHGEDPAGARQETAILKAVQRHPVNERIVHIDFLRVALDKPLVLDIPVSIEGVAAGTKFGGVIQQPIRVVRVRCLPADIPEAAVADVTPLEIGNVLTAGDLKLPPRVELVTDRGQAIVSIIVVKYEEETTAETPAEGDAAAVAGAAAPAAEAGAQPEVIGEKEREERRLKKDEEKGKRQTEKAEVKEAAKEKKK
ncbi:MAG: 50S ribosomal protein L25, partial [bacterium]